MARFLVLFNLLPIILECQLLIYVVFFNSANITIDGEENIFGEMRRHSTLDDLTRDDFQVGIVDDFLFWREASSCSGHIFFARGV
jgi:hypothetical protein